jgi:hypothetical protein
MNAISRGCLPALLLVVALAVPGCATQRPERTAEEVHGPLRFVDVQKFDRDLADSLRNADQPVDVLFYEKVSPNDVPQRLQKWIAAAESGGGKLHVEPPPDEPTPKNPLALIGLLGSLFSNAKVVGQISDEAMFASARGRDVIIALERNSRREIVISKITLAKRRQ